MMQVGFYFSCVCMLRPTVKAITNCWVICSVGSQASMG